MDRRRLFEGTWGMTPDESACASQRTWRDWTSRPHLTEEAEFNARSLLLEFLDDGQKRELEEGGGFSVRAESGRVYEIGHDIVRCGQERYCLQCEERVPAHDAMLARKLLIEADEAEFLRRANRLDTQTLRMVQHHGMGEGWFHFEIVDELNRIAG